MPFDGFDLTHFWDSGDCGDQAYLSDPPAAALIAEIEVDEVKDSGNDFSNTH